MQHAIAKLTQIFLLIAHFKKIPSYIYFYRLYFVGEYLCVRGLYPRYLISIETVFFL